MEVSGDAIAEIVQKQFDTLPQKRKPPLRTDHARIWVPLSGIVIEGKESLKCVALGTGMKCLPQSKISQAQGIVLHDWHAETVALRAFNNFLLHEIQALALSEKDHVSDLLRRRRASEVTESHFQPFAINEHVRIHMYCSEAPCGDASMELTMAAQEDDSPWAPPLGPSEKDNGPDSSLQTVPLPGRAYFSHLGIVRRKPSRPDAPPTLSKSCSDKLSHKQVLSLLSSPLSLLISPENAYLSSLTLPSSQYSPAACTRAFSANGRMKSLSRQDWESSYCFRPFDILITEKEFCFSRRAPAGSAGWETKDGKLVPCNNAGAWTPYGEETLIGGVLQGRKQFDPRGSSMLSKKTMWRLAEEVAAAVGVLAISKALGQDTYGEVKESDLLEGRRKMKRKVREEGLKGWVRNLGGEEFGPDRALVANYERVSKSNFVTF